MPALRSNPDPTFWRGQKVFLTGHTGFKGGWLALWLRRLGAVGRGYALAAPTEPNFFTLARVGEGLTHQIGDVCDLKSLQQAVSDFQPDVIVHLAAQAILRLSYDRPIETFATNLMGTAHALEVARQVSSVKVTLIITTDKCYENREDGKPFRETDPMGGHDPYSSSKGCAELAVLAYGRSFFNRGDQVVASARAGNVFGGGDWACDRLVADIFAALMQEKAPVLRHPQAVRPWQHVLEPLAGYLRAVEYLWDERPEIPECWNFGPEDGRDVCVSEFTQTLCDLWGLKDGFKVVSDLRRLHEASCLKLDSSKANRQLDWRARLSLLKAQAMTVDWYRAYREGRDMQAFTLGQIEDYQKA